MIVLDTTVLVYAVGAEHRFRDPCRALVDAVARGEVAATTTVEVVQEFAHVRARRRGRADAAAVAADYVELFTPLLVVDADDLRQGLTTYQRAARLGCFDAVLAATAARRGASALVSADSAFAEAPGIDIVQPDEAGVERLLASTD